MIRLSHMSKKNHNLIIVAHPDDETIYFSGLIQSSNEFPWRVICITDGDADGMGDKRKKDFHNACRELGVNEYIRWDFPDIYEKRLPIEELVRDLKDSVELSEVNQVYTHGILGEYAHPHHQDVSFAVHQAFMGKEIYSIAYNCYAEKIINLSQAQYDLKMHLLMKNYSSELIRFAHLVPCTFTEGFTKVSYEEVCAIYQCIAKGKELDESRLNIYKPLSLHIRETLATEKSRLF